MQIARTLPGQSDAEGPSPPPALSIIIPTFNEASNLPILFDRLLEFVHATHVSVETIVVDDESPDGTGFLAEELAVKHNGSLSVKVLHRPTKLGLSSALHDGIQVSRGGWVAMLDADNSHDVRSLMDMLRAAQAGADVVVGSRYVSGGRIEDWPPSRRLISMGGTVLARILFHLTVRDPMSGFALIRRDVAAGLPGLLNPRAYKYLLEILVRMRPANVVEVPITFVNRRNGDSKLSSWEIVEFVRLLLRLLREPHRAASA